MTEPGRSEFATLPARPLLIGGCPRSGTTLLRTMLHCHPELAIPRETRFVLESWDRRGKFGDLRREDNRRRLARWIFTRKKSDADRLGLDADEAIERLAGAPPTLGSLLATCFELFAAREGKPRWGDKRPLYAARMAAIWNLFPHAQFVHVVRDPRACVTSMRKLGWYEGHLAPMAELWERSVRTVAAWRPKLAEDQLLEIRYEDLVTDPKDTLARITGFAGLAGEDDVIEQMLRYHEFEEARSRRYHSNLEKPPDPALLSSWREQLTPAETAFTEQAVAPLMQRWGYEPVADGVSPPADLLSAYARRRRRHALAERKRSVADRIRRLVTYRRPVAAQLS